MESSLRLCQVLGFFNIVDLQKAVVPAKVLDTRLVHVAKQPLTTIHAYPDGNRIPGLPSNTHEAKRAHDAVSVQDDVSSVSNERG